MSDKSTLGLGSLHGKKYSKLKNTQILKYNKILFEMAKDPFAKAAVIAEKIGIPERRLFSEIAAARETLGIHSARGMKRATIQDRLTYDVICNTLGVTPVAGDSVVPEAATAIETPVEAVETAPRTSSKLDEYRELVGVLPDVEVAKRAGVTSEAVRLYRRRNNIPGVLSGKTPKAVPSKVTPEVLETTLVPGNKPVQQNARQRKNLSSEMESRISTYAHMLGATSDRKVANLVGVSQESVRRYRLKQIEAGKLTKKSVPVQTSSPVTVSSKYRCVDCARPLSDSEECGKRCPACQDKEVAVSSIRSELADARAQISALKSINSKAPTAAAITAETTATTKTALALLLESMKAEGVQSVTIDDAGVVTLTQRVVTTSSFTLEG